MRPVLVWSRDLALLSQKVRCDFSKMLSQFKYLDRVADGGLKKTGFGSNEPDFFNLKYRVV